MRMLDDLADAVLSYDAALIDCMRMSMLVTAGAV